MNRKGFTLIELVATLLLLAIVSLVSYVSIFKMIQKGNDNDCENIRVTLMNATKSYISDNRYGDNNWGSNIEITAKVLLDNKYLTHDIVDPYTGRIIGPEEIKIKISLDSSYVPKIINVVGLPNNCQS